MAHHAAEKKGIEIGMLQGHMTHKPLQGILGALKHKFQTWQDSLKSLVCQ